MAVAFQDFSNVMKSDVKNIGTDWLHEWGNEIASQAKDNVKLDGEAGTQLRKSYRADVNAGAGEARIGTPLESGYWEEFGTGEHAVNGDGRKGWWVYKDGYEGGGGEILTEAEAKAMAADDPTVHATNGREPSYTLEKAGKKTAPKMEADLNRRLNERFGR